MRTAFPTWSMQRWLLVLVVAAPVLGLLGVVAAEVVPDGRIGYHLLRAEQAGTLDATERGPSSLGTTVDHFSECVALTVGLGDRPADGLVATAMRSQTYIGCEETAAALDELSSTDALPVGSSYLRYWHGAAVIVRPALGILGLSGARWIAFGLLAAVLGTLLVAIHRRVGAVSAALLLGPTAFTTDAVVGGFTLSQAIGLASAWAGGLVALLVVERRPHWRSAAVAGALGGCLVAYFDLLTTLPGSLAVTVVGACLGARAAPADWRTPIATAGGWLVGLAWMWGGKWVIAAAVLGSDDVVDNVRDQVRFRLSGDYEGVSSNRLRGLTAVVEMWWSKPLTPWILAAVAVVLAVTALRRHALPSAGSLVAVGTVVVAVAAWFVVLSNHSQIHPWLVYRSLPIALGAVAALVHADIARRTPEAPRPQRYTARLPSRAHSSVG